MDEAELVGRRLALVAIDQDQEDEKAAVFAGQVMGFGADLVVGEHDGMRTFVVPRDWLPRIRAIEEDGIRETLLGADVVIFLACESLPERADELQYRSTGLHWPRED